MDILDIILDILIPDEDLHLSYRFAQTIFFCGVELLATN